MHDELTRAAAAVPVATLLGLLFGRGVRLRLAAGLLGGALTLLALSDHLDTWRTWLIAAIAAVAACLMPGRDVSRQGSPVAAATRILALTLVATAGAVLLLNTTAVGSALEAVDSREAVLALAGGLGAIFVGGEIIARVLHPLAAKASRDVIGTGMESAGRYIGWLERTLLYGLVLAGAPDAAALVIAGKSIARFPEFSKEDFAEYYLIGSLLSLVIAAGCAIAGRASLGLTSLPSARA